MTIKVLIVDDDRDNADLLGLLLQRYGTEVSVRYSGKSALETLRDFDPDLAIIDICMKEMDGYETSKKIRQHTRKKHIILIALTGYGGGLQDRDHFKSAGFDHHFIKPISFKEISRIFIEMVPIYNNLEDNSLP